MRGTNVKLQNAALIAALIALDQGSKNWAQARFYFGKELIAGWLALAPARNNNQIWLGLWIPALRDPVTATAINIAVLGGMLLAWRHSERSRARAPGAVTAVWALGFSGALCSLFDKLFWNGSLDFLLVRGRVAFDLKDAYIAAAELIFIVTAIRLFARDPDNHRPARTEKT